MISRTARWSALLATCLAAPALAQNDACSSATDAGALPALIAGDTSAATPDSAPGCGVRVSGPGVWYTVTGTGNAITATTCGAVAAGASAAFDSKINVYTGTCGDLACVVSSDDHGGCAGGESTVSWCSTNGTTYYVLVHNFTDEGGAFSLAVTDGGSCAPPANNTCAAAEPLSVNTPTPGTTTWADGGNAAQTGCPAHDRDVWYTFNPTPGQEYTVVVSGATVNTSVAVFAGCDGPELDSGRGDGRTLCRDFFGTNDTQTAAFTVDATVPVLAIRVASGPEASSGNQGSGDEIGGDFTVEVQAVLPLGACCTAGGCSIATQPDCQAAGGSYQGDNTSCSGGTPAGSPTTYGPNNPALPIFDFQPVEDTITVSGTNMAVGAVTVTVDIGHSWIGDLQIDLIHVASGTTVRLWGNQCGNNAGIIATFDDFGGEPICESPVTGTIAPFHSLSGFDGVVADSDWTLRVNDTVDLETGSFNSWSMTIDELIGGPCPIGPSCPCEFGGDAGTVDVFDLLAYLDLWFAGAAAADFDSTPGVDVFDLLAYLDCWFPASAGGPCP